MKKRITFVLSSILAMAVLQPIAAVNAEETEKSENVENVELTLEEFDETEEMNEKENVTSEISEEKAEYNSAEEVDLSENEAEIPDEVKPETEPDSAVNEGIDSVTGDYDSLYFDGEVYLSEETEVVYADGGENELIQLDMPTGLEWGKYYKYDSEEYYDAPGVVTFLRPDITQGVYWIRIYDKDDNCIYNTRYHMGNNTDKRYSFYSHFGEEENIFENGEYYFTVVSVGDGKEYSSSEIAKSDVWHYERPSDNLPVVSDITINDRDFTYLNSDDSDMVCGYSTKIFFKSSIDEEPLLAGGSTGYHPDTSYTFGQKMNSNIYDSVLEKNGNGYYAVKVRLLSRDITKVANSAWSEMSDYVFISKEQSLINEKLDNLANDGSLNDEDVRKSVQDIDTEKLKEAMLVDNANTNTVAKLEELDNRLGGSEIVVNEAMQSVFDETDLKMIGAALNTPENAEENIKLVVDRPKNDDVIPTLYNSTIAVKFSMNLENVQNTEELKVPVKIIIPVPETINPSFLVILHYHVDGGAPSELLTPYIFEKDGKTYASFVLTSFSDFVMTERDASVNGLIQDSDGTWRLYQNGEVRTNFTGLYPYGTSLFHLTNGVLDKSMEGIEYYQKKPYYVVKGQVTYNYTGLGEYKGSLHYFTKSEKDESFNGIAYYKGEPYFVVNGKVTYNYVGLGEYKGSLHYFTKSKKDTTFTGLSYYHNEPYYVLNGIVSYKYNGLGQYKTDWWYVVKSKVDKSYSGSYRWKSKDYTIKNGKVVN